MTNVISCWRWWAVLGMVSLVSERMAIVAVAAFMPLHLWRLSYGVREERPPAISAGYCAVGMRRRQAGHAPMTWQAWPA